MNRFRRALYTNEPQWQSVVVASVATGLTASMNDTMPSGAIILFVLFWPLLAYIANFVSPIPREGFKVYYSAFTYDIDKIRTWCIDNLGKDGYNYDLIHDNTSPRDNVVVKIYNKQLISFYKLKFGVDGKEFKDAYI